MAEMEPLTDMRYDQSIALHAEACRYLAGGVSSNFRLGGKPAPLFFERASGSRLYDVDGNVYLDYALGMGPCVLGHAPQAVMDSVASTLSRGQLYAGQHAMEVRLARRISELVPCAELVRFGMSGSEVDQAAVRVARAKTGRSKVVKFEGHYHGWFDNLFASVHPALTQSGPYAAPNTVPASMGQDAASLKNVVTLPWNDLEVLDRYLLANREQVAGIIMEPILCNTCVILPEPGYLERVRELCTEHGVVLIFDEVITGFRVALNGAQGLLGVTPDLAVFAKAFGGGFPISCLAGRRDLMELFGSGQVMHGGTYNSNTVSCSAALATLEVLSAEGGAIYSVMEDRGRELMAGLSALADETGLPFRVQGLGTVFNTWFGDPPNVRHYRDYAQRDTATQSLFIQLMQNRGFRLTPRGTWFLSAAHSQSDIRETLDAAKDALKELRRISPARPT